MVIDFRVYFRISHLVRTVYFTGRCWGALSSSFFMIMTKACLVYLMRLFDFIAGHKFDRQNCQANAHSVGLVGWSVGRSVGICPLLTTLHTFRFYFIPSEYILISMYIRTFSFFPFCWGLFSPSFHIVLLHFMHTNIILLFSHSFRILCPVFRLRFGFYHKCVFFRHSFRFPFSGHSMRFLFRCVYDVYGYCNVFVGACLDNFPFFRTFCRFSSLLFLFHCCYFSGFDLFSMRFAEVRVCW